MLNTMSVGAPPGKPSRQSSGASLAAPASHSSTPEPLNSRRSSSIAGHQQSTSSLSPANSEVNLLSPSRVKSQERLIAAAAARRTSMMPGASPRVSPRGSRSVSPAPAAAEGGERRAGGSFRSPSAYLLALVRGGDAKATPLLTSFAEFRNGIKRGVDNLSNRVDYSDEESESDSSGEGEGDGRATEMRSRAGRRIFRPGLRDEIRQRLRRSIRQKAAAGGFVQSGGDLRAPEAAARPTSLLDLVSAVQDEHVQKGEKGAGGKRAKKGPGRAPAPPKHLRPEMLPRWMERMNEAAKARAEAAAVVSGAAEAEAAGPLARESALVGSWSRGVRALVATRGEEALLRNQRELAEIARRNRELDADRRLAELRYETIGALVNRGERHRLKKILKGSVLRSERGLLQATARARAELHEELWNRGERRKREVHQNFQEGPALIARFGQILSAAARRTLQDQKEALLLRLHEQGVLLGRVRAAGNPALRLQRLITLNAIDTDDWVALSPDQLTATHGDRPSRHPRWGTTRATDGPWALTSSATAVAFDLVASVRREVAAPGPPSGPALLRALARLLDAVHPSHELHAFVLANPNAAREAIGERLTALGYFLPGRAGNRLAPPARPEELLEDVRAVLGLVEGRLAATHRFYFEVTVPTWAPWMVGWTSDPVAGSPWPGGDAASFGLASDGTAWHDQRPAPYCEPARLGTGGAERAATLGVVADLRAGEISFYGAGGEALGAAFGPGARCWAPDDADEHAERIRKEHLIPAFALMGPTLPPSPPESPSRSASFREGRAPASGLRPAPPRSGLDALQQQMLLQAAPGAPSSAAPPGRPGRAPARAPARRGGGGAAGAISTRVALKSRREWEQARRRFMAELEVERPRSFSRFPPASHRREYAASVVQLAFRKYRARVQARRRAMQMLWSAIKLQTWLRRMMPQFHARRERAARSIQFWWWYAQGLRFRRLCRRYGLEPEVAVEAAVRVQAAVRHRFAQLARQELAERARLALFRFNRAAKVIQRHARVWLAARLALRLAEMGRRATVIQRVWRGYWARACLEEETWRHLRDYGKRLRERQRRNVAATRVQRWYRARVRARWYKLLSAREVWAVVTLQRVYRGYLVRRDLDVLLDYYDAVVIRRILRAVRARREAIREKIRRFDVERRRREEEEAAKRREEEEGAGGRPGSAASGASRGGFSALSRAGSVGLLHVHSDDDDDDDGGGGGAGRGRRGGAERRGRRRARAGAGSPGQPGLIRAYSTASRRQSVQSMQSEQG
eukprot:tig00000241_g20862.t1